MKKIQLNITTPERIIFSEEVDQVTIPTKDGEITVLPEHIPLVGSLVPGELMFKQNGAEKSMAVAGGFIEVLPNKVTILADSAEHADEIDEKRAEEARERARKLLAEKHLDTEEFAALSAKIGKELARLKVAGKKKYRDSPHDLTK